MSIANIEAKLRKNNEDETKISRQEIEKHNTEESSWITINGRVYDITRFAALHVCIYVKKKLLRRR